MFSLNSTPPTHTPRAGHCLNAGAFLFAAAILTCPPAGFGAESAPEDLAPVPAYRIFDRHNARGLPQSTVGSFAQDNDGVLWIGTHDGLARFDGSEITEMEPPPDQPPFGILVDMIAGRRGGLFVAGPTGVRYFDGKTWTLATLRKSIVSIAQDNKNRLWAVDQRGEVWREASAPDGPWEGISMPSGLGPAIKAACGRQGGIWIASRSGVVDLSSDRDEASPPLPSGVLGISAIHSDDEQGIWVGTQKGEVWHLKKGDTNWTAVGGGPGTDQAIVAMTKDRLNRLWCGTAAGLVLFAPPDGPWTVWGTANGLNASAGVGAILADREGTIWVGENAHGAQQFFSEAWSHRTQWEDGRGSVPAVVIGLNSTPSGGLLAAVLGGGLWRWEDGHLRQYGASDGLPSTTRCAAEPERDVLWVGGRGGLFESRNGSRFTLTLALPGGIINGLHESPAHTWYALTTTSGIYALTGQGWEPAASLNQHLVDLNVRDMKWAPNGDVWIATMGGVTVVRGNTAHTYSSLDQPAVPTPAQCLLQVGPDEMWVGGTGGIGVWSAGAWHSLQAGGGLPGRTVYALAKERSGAIWAAGGAGVSCLKDGAWTLYNSHNGLFDDECNLNGLVAPADGNVYVATMGGLARFNPRAPKLEPPPLNCRWIERPEPGPDGIAQLPKGQRSIAVSWSAAWLTPTPVEYRTRITPLDAAWSSPSTAHSLQFANLGPGTWTVEVQARLSGANPGPWTPVLATRLYIPPFFWETVWVPILAAAAVALLVPLLVRARTKYLRRREEQLQQAVAEAQSSVKTLRGLIPICASCKNIRDDRGAWNLIESYVRENSEAEFSHGICPACIKKLYPGMSADEPSDAKS